MKKPSEELTINERLVIQYVLNVIFDGITWDSDMKKYVDRGDLIISLDKSELIALKKAYNKL